MGISRVFFGFVLGVFCPYNETPLAERNRLLVLRKARTNLVASFSLLPCRADCNEAVERKQIHVFCTHGCI